MPIDYRIYPDKKLVYALGVDRVTLEDLLSYLDRLSADIQYVAPMKKLIDYRNCEVDVSMDDVHRFTQEKAELAYRFAGERCAIVVAQDLDFGLARVHGARSEVVGIRTQVFREVEPALRWLDIELIEDEMHS